MSKGWRRKAGEGVDIDEEAATATRAHVLVTPVIRHSTCLRHGKMASETSSLCPDDAGCYLRFTSDKLLTDE
jgi:hypothetical protein